MTIYILSDDNSEVELIHLAFTVLSILSKRGKTQTLIKGILEILFSHMFIKITHDSKAKRNFEIPILQS